MDELIKALKERADLSDDQAHRAAQVIAELLKDEEKRKKIVTAATATTIASAVVTGAI
jgi:inosine-uridine nucleoside N-ribohydrolase